MPAQQKNAEIGKKNYLKHPGNPRCCDFRSCIRRTSKGPSHPNSPSPETSCFSNTCCGHCINARAAAKCAFGAWQQFSDFQKMHQQHPTSKPSKESKSNTTKSTSNHPDFGLRHATKTVQPARHLRQVLLG